MATTTCNKHAYDYEYKIQHPQSKQSAFV